MDIPISSIPVIEPAETEPIEPYVVIAPVITAFVPSNVIPPLMFPDDTWIFPLRLLSNSRFPVMEPT